MRLCCVRVCVCAFACVLCVVCCVCCVMCVSASPAVAPVDVRLDVDVESEVVPDNADAAADAEVTTCRPAVVDGSGTF